ncbi:MAG TPA: porin [Polyangia bacterium]|nr:porin [Polyangia bacterium]
MRLCQVVKAGLLCSLVATALVGVSSVARADITLFEKVGISFFTSGRSAAHYQFIYGDGTPTAKVMGATLTGFRTDAYTNDSNTVATSRIRSGWVGAQLNFGLIAPISPELKTKTYFSFNVDDITNDREKTQGNGIDIREAFTQVEGSFGTVVFGRALSIFGTALAGSVYQYSYGNGVGHPCTVDGQAITCGPVNAGAIFPGFNAQVQYVMPARNGVGMRVALYDPSLPSLDPGLDPNNPYPYTLRPLPRVEAEVTYEMPIAGTGKLVLLGQGLWQYLGRPKSAAMMGSTSANVLGGILAGRIEVADLRVGVGLWGGQGLGTGVPMQQGQAVDPNGELRGFKGYMAHGIYKLGDWDVGAGFGGSLVSETTFDKATPMRSLISSNTEIHAVVYRYIGGLVLGAEFMHWISHWHGGESQQINFMGVGANYLW